MTRSVQHWNLALEAAEKSLVLLENKRSVLPLRGIKSLAVIGPLADSPEIQCGNYNGFPSHTVTLLEGIKDRFRGKLTYAKGCGLTDQPHEAGFAEARTAAQKSDAVVLCLGISGKLGDEGLDRTTLELPPTQLELLKVIAKVKKPIILVLMNGGPIGLARVRTKVDAILEAWYPGQVGGTAFARILFGEVSPSGRLPVTFCRDLGTSNYSMKGRTYRDFEGEPTYGFGFGLSYAKIRYSPPHLDRDHAGPGDHVKASVTVQNISNVASDEVVQLYLHHEAKNVPIRALQGFQRIHLKGGESKTISFDVTESYLQLIGQDGHKYSPPNWVKIWIGGTQPNKDSQYARLKIGIGE